MLISNEYEKVSRALFAKVRLDLKTTQVRCLSIANDAHAPRTARLTRDELRTLFDADFDAASETLSER